MTVTSCLEGGCQKVDKKESKGDVVCSEHPLCVQLGFVSSMLWSGVGVVGEVGVCVPCTTQTDSLRPAPLLTSCTTIMSPVHLSPSSTTLNDSLSLSPTHILRYFIKLLSYFSVVNIFIHTHV